MIYAKRLEDGTDCVIHAPAGTPIEEICEAFEIGRKEYLKMKKRVKYKIAVFSILGFFAAAIDDAEGHKNKISELQEQAVALDEQIAEAKTEKKAVSEIYQTYTNNMKSDYEVFFERAKAEIEEMRIAEQREKEKAEEMRRADTEIVRRNSSEPR